MCEQPPKKKLGYRYKKEKKQQQNPKRERTQPRSDGFQFEKLVKVEAAQRGSDG